METATYAAEFVSNYLFHVHRGVLDCGDRYIVFGNDGYSSDKRSQEEVRSLRERLKVLDLKETGFATSKAEHDPQDQQRTQESLEALGLSLQFASDDGYTWALVIDNFQKLDGKAELEAEVSKCWLRACQAG